MSAANGADLPLTLANGRTVIAKPGELGQTLVVMEDGGEMSSEEWSEYADALVLRAARMLKEGQSK